MPRVGATKFKSFIQQAEGKPQKTPEDIVYPWTVEQLKRVGMRTSWLKACKAFLYSRNKYLLVGCFPWHRTPQGETYWFVRWEGRRELTEKDISFVQALVNYYDGRVLEDDSSSESSSF